MATYRITYTDRLTTDTFKAARVETRKRIDRAHDRAYAIAYEELSYLALLDRPVAWNARVGLAMLANLMHKDGITGGSVIIPHGAVTLERID